MGDKEDKLNAQAVELIMGVLQSCNLDVLNDQERLRLLRVIATIIAKILEIDIQITI